MQEKLTKLLKDRRMLGGLGAAILIIVIAVLIHGRTVNVLQNKYFEPKYEGSTRKAISHTNRVTNSTSQLGISWQKRLS